MIVLGLAGPAGSGKNTVADYLVKVYGFVQFAFSDALYNEVCRAFGLDNEDLLRDRKTKETPHPWLALAHCTDEQFVRVARKLLSEEYPDTFATLDTLPLSPRWVLQRWGTDYRRAQNDNYWLDRAEAFITGIRALYQYPEQAPQHFVECGTRFENEQSWIHTGAGKGLWSGNVWHIERSDLRLADTHASAMPLKLLGKERTLWNNDSIERLHRGIDLLLTTQAKFVAVEPMAPMVEPE